jgi:hypothetical protein
MPYTQVEGLCPLYKTYLKQVVPRRQGSEVYLHQLFTFWRKMEEALAEQVVPGDGFEMIRWLGF